MYHNELIMELSIQKIAKVFSLLFLMFLLTFCSTTPDHFNTKMLISSTLGQKINLDMISEIKKQDVSYQLCDIKQQYDYMAIVQLKSDCGACFYKFMRWNQWIYSNKHIAEKIAVLFLIQDIGFNEFISDLLFYHPDFRLDSNQFYFMGISRNQDFELKNKDINRRILDESLIIDKQQKIRFIGDPFSTETMLIVFNKLFDS